MTVTEAIKSRRTIFRFKPNPVPPADLEQILSYGIWAPNHRNTEPWRFTIIGDQTKEILAQRYREIQIEKALVNNDRLTEDQKEQIGEAGYLKFISKPTIVAVSCQQEGDEQQQREDYAATCCAIQNIQLAAWEAGVGIQWSTGAITLESETYRLLRANLDNEYMVGFLYTGYPELTPKPNRNPFENFLRLTR